MNTLNITRFDLVTECTKQTERSEFIGNVFRGALGRSIARNFCKEKNPVCADCRHRQDCAYFRVFKTPDEVDRFGARHTTPNPFVIKFPYDPEKRLYLPGEILPFSVLLFGNARRFESDVLTAINDMFRGKLENLRTVSCKKSDIIWSDAGERMPIDTLRLRFLTPTQIRKTEDKNDPSQFFLPFTEALFARISYILDLYGDSDFILPVNLHSRKPFVVSRCHFKVEKIGQEDFRFNGVTGDVLMSGDLSKYMPYIALGMMLHVGNMSTRGCGEYECWVE